MRAVVLTDTATEVRDVAEPVPGAGQLLLEVSACGICGSDLHAHAIGIPAGAVLGHEFAGRVVELGAGVDNHKVGDQVCAMPAMSCGRCRYCHAGDVIHCVDVDTIGFGTLTGGMANYVLSDAATSFAMNPSLDPAVGATVEPLAVALNAMDRAAMRTNERLLVLGAGPIGLAVVLWARVLGVNAIAVSDPVEGRRRLAEACGATATIDPVSESIAAACRAGIGGRPDVVIDAAGARGTINIAIDASPYEGRIVIAGLHTAPEEVVVSKAFYKALVISFATWYRVDHFRHTVALLGQGRLDPTPMVTHRVPLEAAPEMFAELKSPNAHGKVLLTF